MIAAPDESTREDCNRAARLPVGSGDRLNLDLQRAEPARQVADVGIAQRAGPSVIRVFATMYR